MKLYKLLGFIACCGIFQMINSQEFRSADIPGIVSSYEEWTAFNWGKNGWYESVIAKKITRTWRNDGQPLRFETRVTADLLVEVVDFVYDNKLLTAWITSDGAGNVLYRSEILRQADVWIITCRTPQHDLVYEEQLSITDNMFVRNSVALGGQLLTQSQKLFAYDNYGREIMRQIRSPTNQLIWESQKNYESFDEHGAWTVLFETERYGSDTWSRPRYRVRRSIDYGKVANNVRVSEQTIETIEILGQEPTFPGAEEIANLTIKVGGSGASIIQKAQEFINSRKIVKGSCFDFVQAVYSAAGYKDSKQREKIFKTSVKGPFAAPSQIQTGDWLYYHHTYSEIVEHSSIFLGWLDFETRAALVMDYPGGNRSEPGRYRVSDLYKLWGIHRPIESLRTISNQSSGSKQ